MRWLIQILPVWAVYLDNKAVMLKVALVKRMMLWQVMEAVAASGLYRKNRSFFQPSHLPGFAHLQRYAVHCVGSVEEKGRFALVVQVAREADLVCW